MTICNDIHTKAIKLDIQSSGIVEKESMFSPTMTSMDINFGKKQNVRNQAQTETHSNPEIAISELQHFHTPTSRLISVSSGYFKDNARIRLELNNYTVLRNLRAKLEGHSSDENELASDYRYQHYLQNITKIEIKQESRR